MFLLSKFNLIKKSEVLMKIVTYIPCHRPYWTDQQSLQAARMNNVNRWFMFVSLLELLPCDAAIT